MWCWPQSHQYYLSNFSQCQFVNIFPHQKFMLYKFGYRCVAIIVELTYQVNIKTVYLCVTTI